MADAVSGAVLAGGASRRMGRDKATAPYGSGSLAGAVVAALAPQVCDVFIVGHAECAEALGLVNIEDPPPGRRGPVAGIAAALAAATTPWILVAACDDPGLPSDLVSRLLAAAPQKAVVPRTDGTVHPLPCLLHRSLATAAGTALAEGRLSLRTWLQDQDAQPVTFPTREGQFRNVNTPEDLHADID